jgi:PAS domain S-box-containing protein
MQDERKTKAQLIGELEELRKRLAQLESEQREQRLAQEDVEQSEGKFRSLAESTTAQISVIQDNRYVYANQAFLDYFEMEREDLELITPEDLMMGALGSKAIEQAKPVWEAAMARGDTSFRFEYQDLEGSWFQTNVTMMELDARPAVMLMVFDITEHKRAQEALAESEDRYRAIFETTGTATIIFDDEVISLANDEWASLTGYSRQEIEGKMSWTAFFSGESVERMQRYQKRRSRDPSTVPRAHEVQLVDREGKPHEGIITVSLVPGTKQCVGSFQDLTELKRAQKEMYRADKMAALGQIIAGVAHEINNPNNFIYFNLPILRRYVEAVAPLLEERLAAEPDLEILNMPFEAFLEDVFKLLENMEHGSARITSIVSDLKNYVRSDEDRDWKVEQVGQVVERVMTLVGKQVRKTVQRLDVEIADALPPVRMNAGKIEQVLINLLINAGHAADKEESWVKVSARPGAEGWVTLLVEDNGAGIPGDDLEQIFEPFYTSKGRDQGTGLGLSISQRIIEEHGGRIRVASTPGEGSCFTVLLPAAREPHPEP